LLVFALGTACGGGGGESSVRRPRAISSPRVTGAPRSQSTASSSPRSSRSTVSDGIAPPAVTDRGAGRIVVVRSLVEYGRWLEWHDPDSALVDRAYAARSALAESMVRGVNEMRLVHKRVVEVDRAPLDFAIVSELANVVSFRVTEHLERRDVVDTRGRTLRHAGPATEHYVIIIMRFASDAPWRLLAVELQGPPIEVQL
jgi:hypothetical protein